MNRRLQVVLDLDTGRYTGRMNKAAGVTQRFGGAVDKSNGSVRQLSSSFNNLNNRMSTPLQKLRDYVLILGNIRLAILNVRDISVGWVGSLVQQSAQVERLTILMRGLSRAQTDAGKTAEAANNMRMLFDEARRTGFAVDALADAFVKMKSGGIDPMDGSLRALTNAVASFGGTSDTFHRASIAIQQMAGKGVISMEELRQQLGEAVPTAMMDMSRAAGMSVKEFTDLVSKGMVQAGPALELMFREWDRIYAGAGERLAGTFTGQLGILKTEALQLANAFTGFNPDEQKAFDGSLYAEVTEQVRLLNEAMTSVEGQALAAEIGNAVADIARAFAAGVRFIVDWRNEIGMLGKAMVAMFVVVKGAQFFKWMGVGSVQTIANLTKMRVSAAKNGNEMAAAFAGVERSMKKKAAVSAVLVRQQDRAVTSSRAAVAATAQERFAIEGKVRSLQSERIALQTTIAAERAKIASAQQAQTVAAGNIASNVRMQTSIQQVKAAKTAETLATIRLTAAERALAANKVATTAATAAQSKAVAANTVAVNAEAVAVARSTTLMRAKAAAMGFAATAARGLGVAINIALGPIGIVAGLLISAAYAAGFFESEADKAAAAADRLAKGLGNLNDIEQVRAKNRANARRIEQLQEEISSGTRKTAFQTRSGVRETTLRLTDDEIAERRAERERLQKEIEETQKDIVKGTRAINLREGGEAGSAAFRAVEAQLQQQKEDFQILSRDDNKTAKEISEAAQALSDRRAELVSGTLDSLTEQLQIAKDSGDLNASQQASDAIDAFKRAAGITDGDDVEKTDQALRDLITPGAGRGGSSAAASQESAARQRYTRMIAQTAGQIAKLEAAANGAQGRLAEFNAEVSAGQFADATTEELEALREGYARIDEMNEQANWDRTFARLGDAVADTRLEAEGLRDALLADDTGRALRELERMASIRGQFAEQIEAAAGDPTRMQQVEEAIQQVSKNLDAMDAVAVADNWREMTEEIELSFLSADEAREEAFQRELLRQQELLNKVEEGTALRLQMEKRFFDWKAAREEQLRRQNESDTTKMARDWANLGSNIDKAMAGSLDGFVDALAEGKLSFEDFAKDMIKQLIKIILRAVIAYAILSALGLANNAAGAGVSFSQFLGGQINAGLTGGNSPSTQIGFQAQSPQSEADTAHTGGIIGKLGQSKMVDPSVFDAAKKFHQGGIIGKGLMPGEVPIIGLKDEAVLTKEQQSTVAGALNSKSATDKMPAISVNVINNSNTQLDAEQGDMEFDGRDMIVSVIVEEAQREGPLRDVLKGAKGG